MLLLRVRQLLPRRNFAQRAQCLLKALQALETGKPHFEAFPRLGARLKCIRESAGRSLRLSHDTPSRDAQIIQDIPGCWKRKLH